MKKILQVFKNLFSKKKKKESKSVIYYICDPTRAKQCPKTGCWYFREGPCQCTKHKEYAKRDEKGNPIIARPIDLWNDAFWEDTIFGISDSQKKQGL